MSSWHWHLERQLVEQWDMSGTALLLALVQLQQWAEQPVQVNGDHMLFRSIRHVPESAEEFHIRVRHFPVRLLACAISY